MGGLIVGIILICIGVTALTGIPLFGFLFAVILIYIGIRMVSRRSVSGGWNWGDYNCNHGTKVLSGERSIDEISIFSSLNRSYTTEHFKGGKIVMVFSGGEIDLTQAKADGGEIDLEVSSVFSGIAIIVPKDWNVKSTANVFLGSVDIHEAQGRDSGTTLTIHGEAVFGEIEVKK
jgi:predicted membrane protein